MIQFNQIADLIKPSVENTNLRRVNVLDIGGDGSFNDYFSAKTDEYYVINESKECISKLGLNQFAGYNFDLETIYDKNVDIVFSNLSSVSHEKYITYTKRILSEAFSSKVILVLPLEWKENAEIQEIIEDYNFRVKSLGFVENIEVVEFLSRNYNFRDNCNKAFIKKLFNSLHTYTYNETKINDKKNLVALYNNRIEEIKKSISTIMKLDIEDRKIVELDDATLQEFLAQRLLEARSQYWDKLKLDLISDFNDKLTDKTIKYIDSKFRSFYKLNLTNENVEYVSREFKEILDFKIKEQIRDLFLELRCFFDNFIPFKSEKYTQGEYYRGKFYLKNNTSIYSPFYVNSYTNGLPQHDMNSREKFDNIYKVAKCLGFDVIEDELYPDVIDYNTKYTVHLTDGSIFMEFKVFKNRKLKIKFNKKFMTQLNITTCKFVGWINSIEDIEKEVQDEDIEFMKKLFN